MQKPKKIKRDRHPKQPSKDAEISRMESELSAEHDRAVEARK